MASISFALFEAHRQGVSLQRLADALELPVDFIEERIEAARLSLLVTERSL